MRADEEDARTALPLASIGGFFSEDGDSFKQQQQQQQKKKKSKKMKEGKVAKIKKRKKEVSQHRPAAWLIVNMLCASHFQLTTSP